MSYRIAGVDVHKKMLAVVVSDVEVDGEYLFDRRGDAFRVQALADNLAKRLPEDTVVQFNYLPTLRAQLALNCSDSSKAIEALQNAIPYELGRPGNAAFTPAPARSCVSTNPSVHWRISASPVPMCCKATPPRPRRPIRIS
jgi:hypothetical protein